MKPIKVDLEYPDIDIDSISMSDCRCLMEDYGGAESELTAILTYIYQAYTISEMEEYKELYETLKGIAITEMHHHELLGETIAKLGGTPVMGGTHKFWNGSMVNYCKDIINMINIDIKAENIAIENYKKTMRCVQNYAVRELIERIIMDEELHILALEEQKHKILERNCWKLPILG